MRINPYHKYFTLFIKTFSDVPNFGKSLVTLIYIYKSIYKMANSLTEHIFHL